MSPTSRPVGDRRAGRRAFAGLALAGVAVLAGFCAGNANAHGTISPSTAEPGSRQRFTVIIPNDSVNVPLTGFRLTPPTGVTIEPVGSEQGWSTTVDGPTLVWDGASVEAGDRGVFGFDAELPSVGGTITFQGEESYPSVPRSGVFPLTVELAGQARGAAGSQKGPIIVGSILVGLLLLASIGAVIVVRGRRAAG